MTSRHLTLFERLTWRFSLLSPREWLVIAVAAVALIGYGFFMVNRGGVCSGEQLHLQIELDQSDRDIHQLSSSDKAGRCKVYSQRRDLLSKATDLMGRCGSGRSSRGSFDYMFGRAAEKGFYDTLVQRTCDGGTPPM